MIPADEGIWDNYRVKRQLLHSWLVHQNLYKLSLYSVASRHMSSVSIEYTEETGSVDPQKYCYNYVIN